MILCDDLPKVLLTCVYLYCLHAVNRMDGFVRPQFKVCQATRTSISSISLDLNLACLAHCPVHPSRLKLRLQALQLRPEILPRPIHITLPLVVVPGRLGVGERFGKVPGDLEDTQGGFLGLLELLFDGVVFGLEREDGSVAFRKSVEVSLGFLRREHGEFGGYQVADCADVLLIVDSGEDALEKLRDVRAGVGRV